MDSDHWDSEMIDSKSMAELIEELKSIATWRLFAGGAILFGLICLSPYPPIFPQITEHYPLICFHAWMVFIACLLGMANSLLDKVWEKITEKREKPKPKRECSCIGECQCFIGYSARSGCSGFSGWSGNWISTPSGWSYWSGPAGSDPFGLSKSEPISGFSYCRPYDRTPVSGYSCMRGFIVGGKEDGNPKE